MPIPGAVTASMGRRLLAHVIDQVAVLLLGGGFVLGGTVPVALAALRGEELPTMGPLVGVGAAAVVALWVFQWWYQAARGYTVGKRLVGLRTLSDESGDPVGMARMLLRLLVVGAGTLVLGLGRYVVLASPLFDSSGRRQGWHDRAAGTMVFDVAVGIDPATASRVTAPQAARRLDALLTQGTAAPSVTVASSSPAADKPPYPPVRYGVPAMTADDVPVEMRARPRVDPLPLPEPVVPAPGVIAAVPSGPARPTAPSGADESAPQRRSPRPVDPRPADVGLAEAHPADSGPAAAHPVDPAPAGPAPTASPADPAPQDRAGAAELEPDVEATRLRPARAKVPELPGHEPHVTIDLTDGRRVTFAGTALVGRDPAPRPGEDVTELIAVPDPGRSVSKTHLAVGVDRFGAWVKDRDSTNGTVVTLTDGQQILCGAGQQVRLGVGAGAAFGDYGLVVVSTDGPPGDEPGDRDPSGR